MRLDKFLADAGMGTRSEVKNIIKKKQVSVNDKAVADPGMAVSESDRICIGEEQVLMKQPRYLMFHKPAGCISATTDREKTVLDYLGEKERCGLFPVGRLDKDTEGLLLLTDDGEFSHHLTSPRRHVNKTYYFEGEGILRADAQKEIAEGIDIGDEKPTLPAELIIQSEDRQQKKVTGQLTVAEGRYHQVKRMLAAEGVKITYLKRISIGGLKLDDSLPKGSWRSLSDEEVQLLMQGRNR